MREKTAAWVSSFGLALLAFCSPSKEAPGAAGLNLLLITLDTTRPGAIGLYINKDDVTPNIDRLGRSGIFFRECYSPVPLTLPAHCSLFTGRYPIGHQVRNNGTYVLDAGELTMAEVFKAEGYETAAVVSSFTVFSKFGLSQGFDVYDEDFDSREAILNFAAEIPADRVYEKFEGWLDRRAKEQFFCWVHFYDPHAPYLSHGGASGQDGPSSWSRYQGEVTFVDAHIGRMIEALRAANLADDTVIVIVGDHGEAFGEHQERGHGIFCYEESLRVPLIIHNPRVFPSPKEVAERVSLADVLPTLLELYEIKVPAAVQGKSFLRLIGSKPEKYKRVIYFESLFGKEENNWAPLTGLIDGGYKYISLPEPELYDLPNDGRETRNLLGIHPDIARAMDRKLEQFIRAQAGARVPTKRKLGPGDLEKLKALGYVSSFSGQAKQTLDPKKGIALYQEVAEIKQFLLEKNYARAEEQLAAVLSRNPGIDLPDIYEISYQVKRQKGEAQACIEILEKAMTLFPDNDSFKVFLGMTYIESGDLTGAEDFCRGLLADNDKMTAAHVLLGDAEDRLNKIDGALLSYDNALALEPQNGMVKVKVAAMLIKKGELLRARAILEELENHQAVVQTSEYLDALSNLGRQLLSAGEGEKALALYQKAAAISPENPDVWLNLGSAYFLRGQYDAAVENFRKSLALDEKSALAHSNIGLVYMTRFIEENDPALVNKALESFDRAIELDPNLAAAYNGRGWAFAAKNRMDQAVRDYERAIGLNPEMMDAYVNISLALEQQGRHAEALKYLDVCRKKFSPRMSPQDREEFDRLYSQIKALKNGT